MKINRFPKMAALQKFRAIKLGFGKDLAEAIGYAEALKYAIFKNVGGSFKKYKEYEDKNASTYSGDKSKFYQNADWNKFSIFKLASVNGHPFVGNKVITKNDYEREIFHKFGPELGKKIEDWAENIIRNTPEDLLQSESKFFNKVWKEYRDEEI